MSKHNILVAGLTLVLTLSPFATKTPFDTNAPVAGAPSASLPHCIRSRWY